MADYLSGLQVVDLSKPFKPQIVGSVGLPGPADKLAVSDFYAYVGDSGAGLQVVDISNPSAPRIVATVNTPGLAGDVKVSGSYAYVADFDSGLQVINLCPSISVLQADRFTSISEDDGWVLESTETSNVGGLFGATAAHALALRIGDDYGGVAQGERQFKSIVSFDTSRLPDDATVVSAVLCLTIGDVVGRNPVETHKPCYLDIKTGTFGTQALEASDFQAEATATQVAIMSASSAGRRVSVGISDASGLEAINKVGLTQMRVYFSRDDNDDDNDDFIGVYSGETSAGNTPVLKVWFLEPVHPNLDE
ncbi:MAG: hypothetical protein HY801_00370 [Candidatus Lindowbacteria bacterium]|nr:hypothetical protein [Candidatus Lindowbacteria bacterium]